MSCERKIRHIRDVFGQNKDQIKTTDDLDLNLRPIRQAPPPPSSKPPAKVEYYECGGDLLDNSKLQPKMKTISHSIGFKPLFAELYLKLFFSLDRVV